jgi:hypothetical protein
MQTMSESKHKAGRIDLKALVGGDRDVLWELMRAVLQEILEAEMSEALGAAKSERTMGQRLSLGLLWAELNQPGGQTGVAGSTGSDWTVFDRAVRALAALGTRIGGGAGGDVGAGSFDGQG